MPGLFGAETFSEEGEGRLRPWGNESLSILVGAIGVMYEQVQEIARDGDQPGWTVPLTLSLAKELDWLGQFLGVRRSKPTPDADFRVSIGAVEGFSRGTPASIKNAAGLTLTGAKKVNFYERLAGDAYDLTVVTYTTETPNPAATEAAIRSLKPAGIKLTFVVVDGLIYLQLYGELSIDTYSELKSTFANYTALRDYKP